MQIPCIYHVRWCRVDELNLNPARFVGDLLWHNLKEKFTYNFQMKETLNLAILVVLATTTAFATEMGNNNHHREKRAIPKLAAIPLLAYKSGGSGASPLPPHIDPNIGQSSA